MEVQFTKMHGLGNDFVVIDAINQKISLTTQQVRAIADRHTGIGCDQVLIVAPTQAENTDFRYRIYNRNGAEVEQCGNGARCFARFVHDKGLSDKKELKVQTKSGNIVLYMEEDGQVRVNMGMPVFEPDDVPFVAQVRKDRYVLGLSADLSGDRNPQKTALVATKPGEVSMPDSVTIGVVSMGNPHAVIHVEDVDAAPVAKVGAAVESHKRFPNRTNVGFMQILDRNHIRLRVYERGVGETLACGTGACAAVVLGRKWGLLDEVVNVSLPGGDLVIQWGFEEKPVWMTGPAQSVFEGRISL
ncbi:MAG: diaminopimelate epimerase [Gammaproteobacteria bacterium]|nr:diaminopimelate epimerase [Gammaproteobacteria bacterium]MDH5800286.1 diaminopimelate epimerase [Gammaproteobacteria bacterium]